MLFYAPGGDNVTDETEMPDHDCPVRVRNIVTELFDLAVAQGHRIDDETAAIALNGARTRLGEICHECLSGAATEEPPRSALMEEPVADNKPAVDNKRKYFLLRMISCKLSHLFDATNNHSPLDRACSHGIDTYMHRIFSKGVYDQINTRAEEILSHTGTGDTNILNAIMDNPDYKAFLENVLVRFAISFIKYKGARDLFISDLNMAMPNNAEPLTLMDFKAIIRALLSDIFLLGKVLGGNDLLDYRYGANTAAIIDRVADEFSRDM